VILDLYYALTFCRMFKSAQFIIKKMPHLVAFRMIWELLESEKNQESYGPNMAVLMLNFSWDDRHKNPRKKFF